MNKELVKYGIAAKKYNDAQDAKSHTYMTQDGQLVSTPLIFPANPYNEDVKTAKHILDIGCGVGRNLPWIMENTNAMYTGIDPHPQMVEYFWQVQDPTWKTRAFVYHDFDAMVMDTNNVGMMMLPVDVVVCTFVFQHIGFRPPAGQMNAADITKEAMKFCHSDTVWILYEHDGEEDWIGRWMDECDILPQVFIRDFLGIPELTHRGPHHLIIFKQR